MAFLGELGKTLSDTGKEVATKAKALTEAIQLRTQISSEKSKLDEAYLAIGKRYFELHPIGEEVFSREYDIIRAGLTRIAAMEEELCQTEGTRMCAECGAKVPKDSAFCGKCGAAMAVPVNNPVEEPHNSTIVADGECTEVIDDTAGMGKVEEEKFVPTQEY